MGGGALLYLESHLVGEVLWFVGDEPIQVTADVRYRPRREAMKPQHSRLPAWAEPTTIRPRLWGDPIMMLVPEVQEFAAAIRENRQPAITAADGRKGCYLLPPEPRCTRVHSLPR